MDWQRDNQKQEPDCLYSTPHCMAESDGMYAVTAKYFIVNEGLCQKAKQKNAILERLHEEMHDTQFDILDALMNLAGGFVQRSAAQELGLSFCDVFRCDCISIRGSVRP